MSDIKLPVDATGKEIPLDTKFLYNPFGVKREIIEFKYSPADGDWTIAYLGDSSIEQCVDPSGYFTLDPSDSWEKLLEDLDAASCGVDQLCVYMSRVLKNDECSSLDCCVCNVMAFANIADRIRKLRGEGDE